jgi:integrase
MTFTPHSLRHSFGTNMALSGMELDHIADQMSHSSIETTMRYRNMAGQIKAWRRRQGTEPTVRPIRTPLFEMPRGQ